jgi:hypothetical protein
MKLRKHAQEGKPAVEGSGFRGRRRKVGSDLWRGDVRRYLRTNLEALGPGGIMLLTVTAPGRDLLPMQGDVVESRAARLWNRSASKRWSQLWRRAQQDARRHGHASPLICCVWQMQRRGVLHLHLVLDYRTSEAAAATRHVIAYVRSRRRQFGFGHTDARLMPTERAARYLSHDLTDERGQLLAAARLRDRPRRLEYVRSDLLQLTRCTMRRLHRVRQLWAHLNRDAATFAWMRNEPLELLRVSLLLRGELQPQGP